MRRLEEAATQGNDKHREVMRLKMQAKRQQPKKSGGQIIEVERFAALLQNDVGCSSALHQMKQIPCDFQSPFEHAFFWFILG
jgi:hypothetical protein